MNGAGSLPPDQLIRQQKRQAEIHQLLALNQAISSFAIKTAGFMHAAGQEVSIEPKFTCELPEETKSLRRALILEECEELIKAIKDDDFIGIADGIADVLYVVIGTALAYGIPTGLVFDIVSENNMTKINLETGKVDRAENGKILKPEGYKKVELEEPLKQWADGIKTSGGDAMFIPLVVEGFIRQFKQSRSLIAPANGNEAERIAILTTN